MDIKLYADGANIDDIADLSKRESISGFTTNPTLMKLAGINDYLAFAKKVIKSTNGKPISLEVFSDDLGEMKRQAELLTAINELVYVKIPVTNTKGVSTAPIIAELSAAGVKLNVTAIFSIAQVKTVVAALEHSSAPSIVSVFAGRIADTGIDPVPHMSEAKSICGIISDCELLWASPREVLNVFQANDCGCDIITATPEILAKLERSRGKELEQFSLETVQMFYNDAKAAGYSL